MLFCAEVEALGYSVQGITIRTDRAKEYIQGKFAAHCEGAGIRQETTAPYVHTNNSIAERFWRTLLNKVRALLLTGGLETKYWPLAAAEAEYLYNRTAHSFIDMGYPVEKVTGKPVDLSDLRAFGCTAFMHVDHTMRGKLDDRAIQGQYVGHEMNSSAYRILIPETGEVRLSGMVHFVEEVDAYSRVISDHSPALAADFLEDSAELWGAKPVGLSDRQYVTGLESVVDHKVTFDSEDNETYGIVQVKLKGSKKLVWVFASALGHEKTDDGAIGMLEKHLTSVYQMQPSNPFYPIFTKVSVTPHHRSSHSTPATALVVSTDHESKYGYGVLFTDARSGQLAYQDILTSRAQTPAVAVPAVAAAPLTRFTSVGTDEIVFPSIAAAIGARPMQEPTPRTWAQAQKMGEHWVHATWEEVQSYIDFGVIEPLDFSEIPQGKNIVDSKLIWKIKYNGDGTVDKYKARLVVRGFTEVYGEDYHETFAPVSQLVTVRMLLALCLNFSIRPHHVDVKCAFLNSVLKEEVYMRLPTGFSIGGKKYGKVLKSVYGLKQAAHDWYETQHDFIMTHDSRLQQSCSDPCLYYLVSDDLVVFISTHVDDYVIGSSSDLWYDQFIAAFGARFEITDMGVVEHVLQMTVDWTADTCSIGQERQITELLEKYDMRDHRPVQTPMEAGLYLFPCADSVLSSLPYRELLGALLWLARCTRPDIFYAIIYLARFSSCYGATHYKALKRVLRYVGSTSHYRLRFTRSTSFMPSDLIPLLLYTDSDWAGDPADRKSVSGVMGYVLGCLVCWDSKKQKTVALSSCESEYYAITDGAKWALHLIDLVGQMLPVDVPVAMHIDNVGAGYMSQNAINNQRTKHIDIRYHFIRHLLKIGVLELFYVDTKLNVSDVMTKPLSPEVFTRRVCTFMHTSMHEQSSG